MWEEIAKIIGGGGVMDQIPNERQGVRPGFGLEGASIRGSDIYDQLRNAERRDAAVPSPKKPLSLSSSRNIAKFYGNRADIERSLAQLANNTEGYSPQVLERIRQKLLLALERSSK